MGHRISETELRQINENSRSAAETKMFLSLKAQNFRLRLPMNYQFPSGSGYYYNEDHGYNFLVNISHPAIEPFYMLFKQFRKKKAFPLNDEERRLFEADMIVNLFRTEFEKQFAGISKGVIDKNVGILLKYRTVADEWRRYRELSNP